MPSIDIKVPDIGDFKDVAVIEIFVKPGDTVKKEQSLITVESDKASMEIPSSDAGVVKEVKVKLGDKVSQGTPLVVLEGAGGGGGRGPPPTLPPHEPAAAASAGLPHASPSIRKLARELGVPLEEVKGSGPKGRITQEDVHGFVKNVMAGAVQTKAQAAKAPPPAATAGAFPGLLPWPQI